MSVKIENLDHLGIVAGIIDKIVIVEIIDENLGSHSQRKMTTGQAVQAMLLNGLGFVSAPLYLYAGFFEGKATEHLLGKNITAEMLNDDLLGRVLDRLFNYGISQIFSLIAMSAFECLGLEPKSYPLDSTSIAVHGKYTSETEGKDEESSNQSETVALREQEEEPQIIEITHGYSRD